MMCVLDGSGFWAARTTPPGFFLKIPLAFRERGLGVRGHYTRIFGSSQSLSESPSMLKESTAADIAMPGKTTVQGDESM